MNSICEAVKHPAPSLKPYSAYKDSGVEWLGNVAASVDQLLARNVAN